MKATVAESLAALCRIVFIFLPHSLSPGWYCTLLWLKCILPCICTHKQKAFHGWLNLIVLPPCTKGSCFDFDLFSRSNNALAAVNATRVPLLKVHGWTENTLALIDLGRYGHMFLLVSLIHECLRGNWNWMQIGDKSFVLIQSSVAVWRRCNTGSLSTDCNYCTFFWVEMASITNRHLSLYVGHDTISFSLSKWTMSVFSDNEWTGKQARYPFWPTWIACLTSQ